MRLWIKKWLNFQTFKKNKWMRLPFKIYDLEMIKLFLRLFRQSMGMIDYLWIIQR